VLKKVAIFLMLILGGKKMKKSFCALILLLALVGNAFAAVPQTYIQWNGLAGDGSWNTAGNWNTSVVPSAQDLGGVQGAVNGGTFVYKAGFKTPGVYPAFSSGTLTTDVLVAGGTVPANPGGFTVSGATINVSEYITLAANNNDYSLVTINSGTVSTGVQMVNQPFYVSQLGTGKLLMEGGTIYVGNYQTPATPLFTGNLLMTGVTGSTGSGTLDLDGGIIYANDLLPGTSGTFRSLVVKDGTLVLKTDRTTELAGYSSWLTAAPGYTLHTAYNAGSGTTTVWATIPEPATICLLGFGVLSLIRRKK
jgi:hypothetical protein